MPRTVLLHGLFTLILTASLIILLSQINRLRLREREVKQLAQGCMAIE